MIKNQMLFPLAVDTTDIKATTDILYTATDEELEAYSIGYVPFTLLEQSTFYKAATLGTFSNIGYNFSYTVAQSFAPDRGVPFCYIYAQSASTADINAYNDGNSYINLPWGSTSAAGLIHAYNTDNIVTNSPGTIPETTNIMAWFKMFAVYLPDGSSGGASPSSGSNGWVSRLVDRTANINPLDLTFSVTSGTDGSYMPTPVTFTKSDLEAATNGIMKIANGTTTYAGITYNITVHCIIANAYLDQVSANNLKDGVIQLNSIRYSGIGSANTPFYKEIASNSTVANIFTAGIIADLSIDYPNDTVYYMLVSDGEYEYFKVGTGANHFLSAGFTIADLKILRSTARPIYKISGAFYVAEFNDDYTITGELIPYAQARAWQKNINGDNNEFNYEDIPEPEPPTISENIGDKITRPATLSIGGTKGFITQYALNATQVGQLGQILWTSVFDTDYWKNFMFSLALDTGSFSLSSLLGFFLSLKVYPFSMVNVPSYASFGQDMYFGTGIKELHFTTNIHTINDYADYISGGWCTVTSNNFYNDYRDYVNTEITLYVPYCGTVQLNPGDVIGNKISVQYAVDFATGGCIAYVDLETGDGAAGYPIAAMHGQIGADVPLTATAAGEVAARFIGDAANAAGLIGGQVGQEIETASGALQGKFKPTPGSVGFALGGPAGAVAGFAASVAPGLGAQALNMLTRGAVAAPILSGGRGFASFGAPQVPYIQIRRGIYPADTNLINVAGKPAAAAATIGDLTGYIKGTVKAEGLAGVTQEEQAAIISHIAAGIFV